MSIHRRIELTFISILRQYYSWPLLPNLSVSSVNSNKNIAMFTFGPTYSELVNSPAVKRDLVLNLTQIWKRLPFP